MGVGISTATLDDVRARGFEIVIAAAAANGVDVRQRGGTAMAVCPFHPDRNPSLSISAEGLWRCHGCEAGGDAIRFVQDLENLDFVAAVERCAALAGVEFVVDDTGPGPRRDPFGGVLTEVADRWQRAAAANDAVLAYLAQRGVTADDIARFRIGWCPPVVGDWADGLDPDVLASAGLMSVGRDDRRWSMFSDRITFPWTDRSDGPVIAFGARIWREGDVRDAKYVNTATSERFAKQKTLYGVGQAHRAARRAGRVLVVEGYLDVVAAARAGFANTVAVAGVALTQHHANQLARMCRADPTQPGRVTVLTDADPAGVASAVRAVSLDWPNTVVEVASLPAGLDPDDLIRADPAGFAGVVGDASLGYRFVLDQAEHEDLSDPVTLAEQVTVVEAAIRGSVPPLSRRRARAEASERLQVQEGDLATKRAPAPAGEPSSPAGEVPPLEWAMVGLLATNWIGTVCWVDPDWFVHPSARAVVEAGFDAGDGLTGVLDDLGDDARALVLAAGTVPSSGADTTIGLWLAGLVRGRVPRDQPDVARAVLHAPQGDHTAMNQLFDWLSDNPPTSPAQTPRR